MSYRKVHDLPSGYELNKEAGFWSVAVPEETTNLIKAPNFDGSSPFAGGAASGGSSALVDSTWRAFGKYSAVLTLLAAGTYTLTISNSDSIFTPNAVYTWSDYLKGTAGKSILMEAIWSNGSAVLASKTLNPTGKAERPSLTFTIPAGMTTGQSILLKLTNTSGSSNVFNIDARQLEPKAYPTTYIDGEQPGGTWLGPSNNAYSVRSATAPGGRIYDFKKDFGYSITGYLNAGMLPIEHQSTDQINLGGKTVQKSLPSERNITLMGALEGRPYDVVLAKVDAMTQALAPATGTQPRLPLQLMFTPYSKTSPIGQEVFATVLYSSGMELETTSLNQVRYALSFTEFTPIGFQERVEQYSALSTRASAAAGNAFVKRIAGEWDRLPRGATPAAGGVVQVVEGLDKSLYVASGSGTTYRVDKITYNPITNTDSVVQSWTGFNGAIRAMAVLPTTGEIIVGGDFTSPFAYTAILSAAGVINLFYPANAAVYALYVDPVAGYVWMGGDFTSPGTRLALLDYSGALVQALAAGARVRAIVGGPKANQVYIGGEFGTVGPGGVTTASKLALVEAQATGTPTYSAVNGGVNAGHIYALVIGLDGTLYVGGAFTQDNNSGTNRPLLRVGKLAAGRLVPVASGFSSGVVYSLAVDSAGNIYASKDNSYFVFDGTNWNYMEPVEYGNTSAKVVYITSQDKQIVTYEVTAGFYYFAGTTDIINKGSAPAYPKIKLYGSTTTGLSPTVIHKVTNTATGASIYLEYSIRYGEIVTLDFTDPKNIQITSNVVGNIKPKMISTSQWNSFFLVPSRNGTVKNKIVVHSNLDFAANALPAEITWRNTYQGIEGSVK